MFTTMITMLFFGALSKIYLVLTNDKFWFLVVLTFLVRRFTQYLVDTDDDFHVLPKTASAELRCKLPGNGSQGPSDWGTTSGIQAKLTSATVREIGTLDMIIVGGGVCGLCSGSLLSQVRRTSATSHYYAKCCHVFVAH